MSVASEIERIEIMKEEINDRLESLGVNRGASLAEMAQNITVLKKPTGSAGQLLGFVEDDVIGAVDAQAGNAFARVYVRSAGTPLTANWLSFTKNGAALTPRQDTLYIVMSEGDYLRKCYLWDGYKYRISAQKVNTINRSSTEDITGVLQGEDFWMSSDIYPWNARYEKLIEPYTTSIRFSYEETNTNADGTGTKNDVLSSKNIRIGTTDNYQSYKLNEFENQFGREYTLPVTQDMWGKTFLVTFNVRFSSTTHQYLIGGSLKITREWTEDTDEFYQKKGGLLPKSTNNALSIFTDDGKWTKVSDLIGRSFASNGLVGEVCLYMSPIVPPHFLACDGAQYNVSDYPQLYDVLKEVDSSVRSTWGSANWTTTFNVPNIQGEFPRFSGTNSHANQGSGGAVGAHQDGTEIPNVIINHPDNNENNIYFASNSTKETNIANNHVNGRDASKNLSSGYKDISIKKDGVINRTDARLLAYTTRPTNTSFFGVIRYEASDELSVNPHGGAPVGTIFPYDGLTAPDGYLLCDGTVYNITAHPELAEHIRAQHGSYNFYGGDGSTTFAVPDLRGEFIRGAGANSHTGQGNGSEFGVHQNGTEIPYEFVTASNNKLVYRSSNNDTVNNILLRKLPDATISGVAGNKQMVYDGTANELSNVNVPSAYTARPTNTSYNFIIKASSFDSKGGDTYGTSEVRCGTWIDEKPLYRRVFTKTIAALNNETRTWTAIVNQSGMNIDMMMVDEGLSSFAFNDTESNTYRRMPLSYINGFAASTNTPAYQTYSAYIATNGNTRVDIVTQGNHVLKNNSCDFTIVLLYTKTTD